jgi:hypothetical protein
MNMPFSKQQIEAMSYFDERYTIIFDSSLIADKKTRLSDHENDAGRVCRFCGRGKPDVTFKSDAHAVPEFLGNKTLLSMNECDACNNLFAGQYETDLASWFGPLRTISQMRGKGIPTYKDREQDGDVRIEMGDDGLKISIVDKDVEAALSKDGPFVLKLPAPTPTKPYVPINAAKALIKVACSLCPGSLLPEVQPAIDWLMGRAGAKFSKFPVLFGFTPGPNPYNDGKVMLLRRKVDEPIPFLWCIVATYNYRFQFFVPFCPADKWASSGEMKFTCAHFPFPFSDDWPHRKTQIGVEDWSGTEKVVRNVTFGLHVERVEEIPIPPKREGGDA